LEELHLRIARTARTDADFLRIANDHFLYPSADDIEEAIRASAICFDPEQGYVIEKAREYNRLLTVCGGRLCGLIDEELGVMLTLTVR
jgi:hypothetical protein